MTVVKNLKAQYERYLKTPATQNTLYSVYSSFSRAKENAYNYCVKLFCDFGGHQIKIIGANSSTFSAGFIGKYEGKKAFFYITKDYDRVMLLED